MNRGRSRLSDKVMDYYMKFGKDRDLEKFMRLCSQSETSSSDDMSRASCKLPTKERGAGGEEPAVQESLLNSNKSDKKEHFVAIQIETDCDDTDEVKEEQNEKPKPSPSLKSPRTPKNKNIQTKQTQTPESVTTSHKRLEWDSLGDVGYKKSKSTSNVSIVERMLLREFFEVATHTPKNVNSSESDIRLLEQEIADLGTLKKHFSKTKPTTEESNCATPPLASSTHVETKSKYEKPQVCTVGTNTSILLEKHEKYAQTSVRKSQVTSKEVQVMLSPSSISPLLGSSADPSSFEYRSRYSTNSSEGQSMKSIQEQAKRIRAGDVLPKSKRADEIQTEIAKKNIISQKDLSTEAEVCDRLKDLFISWNKAMEANKENSSGSSSCSNVSNTPQIDLGIQLISGIMKAENIDQKQKKRLVRNIVKRITKIANSCELDAIVSKTGTLIGNNAEKSVSVHAKEKPIQKTAATSSKPMPTNETKDRKIRSKTKTVSREMNPDIQKETKKDDNVKSKIDGNSLKTMTRSRVEQSSSTSTRISSDTFHSSKTLPTKPTSDVKDKSDIIYPDESYTFKALPAIPAHSDKSSARSNIKEVSPIASRNTAGKTSTSTSSKDYVSLRKEPIFDIQFCVCKTDSGGNIINAIISEPDSNCSNSAVESDSSKLSSTSSKDLTTNKKETRASGVTSIELKPKNDKYSTEISLASKTLPANSSALKPNLTESVSTITISTTAEGSSSGTTNDDHNERSIGIKLCVCKTDSGGKLVSAIVTKPECNSSSSLTSSKATISSSSLKELPIPMHTAEVVPSKKTNNDAMQEWLNPMTQSEVEFEDKKRTLEGSRTKSQNYFEVDWIDGEIERLRNLKHNLLSDAKAIARGPDIQSSSDKLYDTVYSEQSSLNNSNNRMLSPVKKFSLPKQTKVCKCTQTACLPKKSKATKESGLDEEQQLAPQQRSKIDTPTYMARSESVNSFVKQRKQEFLNHYKSQKLQHYDQIMQNHNNERPSTSIGAITNSQVLSKGGKISSQQPNSYYTYPPKHHSYRDPANLIKTLIQTVKANKQGSSNIAIRSSRESSELSVPMGSYNTSSAPTTTHQYDVATTGQPTSKANIGAQTGHSLRQTRPIYETRPMSTYPITTMVPCCKYVACTCMHYPRTACVQARPKGISYSLQFMGKPSRTKPENSDESSYSSSEEEFKTLDNAAAPSLQVALKRGNPKFLVHAKKRKSILNTIQKRRQERERELREIADENTSINSLERKLKRLPPPVIEQVRIFPTKQMKSMTKKRVAKLPEVLANQEREREQRYKRSNRMLREIFTRRLRQRVRKGTLTLNHSQTLI